MPIAGLTLDSKQTNTHQKRKRVPGEISHDLLPTYLIWYEDQGDVVPLNMGERDKQTNY